MESSVTRLRWHVSQLQNCHLDSAVCFSKGFGSGCSIFNMNPTVFITASFWQILHSPSKSDRFSLRGDSSPDLFQRLRVHRLNQRIREPHELAAQFAAAQFSLFVLVEAHQSALGPQEPLKFAANFYV